MSESRMKKSARAVPGPALAVTRDVLEAGLVGRFVRDRREQLLRVGCDAALDEAAVADLHRPVERLAVVAVLVDIFEEVGARHRRMAAVDGDDDAAEAGFERDGHDVLSRSRDFGGCGHLGRDGSGGESADKQGDSDEHAGFHSRAEQFAGSGPHRGFPRLTTDYLTAQLEG